MVLVNISKSILNSTCLKKDVRSLDFPAIHEKVIWKTRKTKSNLVFKSEKLFDIEVTNYYELRLSDLAM
jgi:hypothetical protein